jgi:hypothetical protein
MHITNQRLSLLLFRVLMAGLLGSPVLLLVPMDGLSSGTFVMSTPFFFRSSKKILIKYISWNHHGMQISKHSPIWLVLNSDNKDNEV